jgi:hypothetical protein
MSIKYRRIYRISRAKLEEITVNLARKRGIENDIKIIGGEAIEFHYQGRRYLRVEKPLYGQMNLFQYYLQRDIVDRNPEFLGIELGKEYRKLYPWLRVHIEMP